ncbi:MAG TPA: GNAT family N-acetyltransferase [Longimicrobium sp.]|nr:GNAT family N-acetyltransferase [Longimicrobium sp.]
MFEIRAATQADAASVAAIHVRGWKTTYRGILPDGLLDALRVEDRLPQWLGWIEGPRVHTLVACRGAEPIGFVRLCPARPIADPPPEYAEITHLYVDRQAHGGGVGRALIGRALQIARTEGYRGVLLWVLEENHRARAFYEAAGLRADGTSRTEPAFLGNDAAEVRYALAFAPEPA